MTPISKENFPVDEPLRSRQGTTQRRTVSVRVLVISLLLAGTALPSLHFLRKWQLTRTATAYLDRATELEKKEEWLAAADYISRFLTLRPRDAAAEVRLAETFAKGANTPRRKERAMELLYQALGNNLKDKQWPVRQTLVDLLVQTSHFQEAEAESRKILAHNKGSQLAAKSLAIALFGRAATAHFNNMSSAELKKLAPLATIDKARKQQPTDVELAVLEAHYLRRFPDLVKAEQPKWSPAQREQAADACLDELIAELGAKHEGYLARFGYRQQYALAGADDDLAEALKLSPSDASVLSAAGLSELAAAQRLEGRTDSKEELIARSEAAVKHLTVLIAQHPKTATGMHHLALGEAQLLAGRHDDAVATWTAGIKKFAGSELAFEAQLADAYLDLNKLADAKRMLATIERRIDTVIARISGRELAALKSAQEFRQARLTFQSDDRWGAVPKLKRVVARTADNERDAENGLRALVMLGQIYASLGQWREAAEMYDEAGQRNPRLPQVRLAAAQSWLAAGLADPAAERAEQSLALRGSTEAWFALAAALYRQQISEPAAARDWSRFDLALVELQKNNEASPLPRPWQVDLLRVDSFIGRADEANIGDPQQVLRDLESRYPSDVQLWSRIALIWQRLKLPDEADRCIAHLRTLPEGTLPASQTLVRLHRARDEHGEAESLLSSLVGSSPVNQRNGLVRDWVNLKLAREDYDGARQLLVKELEAQPSDLQVLLMLAELDAQAGRWSESQKWEARLAKMPHPAAVHARVLKVRRLLAGAKSLSDAAFVQAETELRRLQDEAPSWPAIASLSGSVAQRRGDKEEAARHYLQAVALGEQRLGVFENLIAVLEGLGRYAEAQEYLQKLESQVPLNQNLTVLQGAVEMKLDQPERALSAARKAVKRRPQEVEPRLWLAKLLAVQDQPEEAEAVLKSALEMAPKDLKVYSALQLFYLRTKNSEAALKLAAEVQRNENLPESERHFLAAQTFELASERDLAEQSYERAAAADPTSAAIRYRMAEFYLSHDSQKAEECLDKTLELDPGHRSARRTLAMVLASRGGDEDWSRAMGLLGGQGADSGVAAGHDRLTAILSLQRGGNDNIARAQSLLEKLRDKPGQSGPIDKLLLAQVYERQAMALVEPKARTAKLELARQQLEQLVRRSEAEWTHFVALIEFCDRRQQSAEVARWLAAFEASLGEQKNPLPEAIVQLVRMQLKHGAADKSAAWLDRLEAKKTDELTVLLLRAQWCNLQGLDDEIEERVDDAAERLLAEESTPAGKLRLMSRIAALYRSVKQFAAAERWERRVVGLDAQRYEGLAAVLTEQGRWSDAVELCRRAAESDKSARPALVALACLSSGEVTDEKVADCEPLVQAAMRDNRQNADLHYSLGVVRVIQERTADAIAEFRQVVKINPRHVPAMNNLALLLAEDKTQQSEAIRVIDRAIDQAGLTPDLLDTKGTILLLAGRAAEAVRLLEMATQGRNVDPRFEFHLALAYFDQGQLEKAGLRFEQAIAGGLEKQILTRWDQQQLDQLRRKLNVNFRTPSPAIASE